MASQVPPTRGVALRVPFSVFDYSGNLLTGATFGTVRVNKDFAGQNAAANAVVEVGNGEYSLVFTATEMTADLIQVLVPVTGYPDLTITIRTAAQTEDDIAAAVAAIPAAPSAAVVSDAVWDEVLAGHLAAGSTGAALNTAGSATTFPAGAINYTYTVTDSLTLLPLDGVQVWFATDLAGTNIVWSGVTDAFGVARDVNLNLPALNAGTYYAWVQLASYTATNPQTIVVS